MTEAKAPAPDFALPLRAEPTTHYTWDIRDADGKLVAAIPYPNKEWAEKLVSTINNAAAKDAEIARLREALESAEYALTRLRALVKSTDSLQGREHVPLGIAVNDAIDRSRAALSSIPTASDTEAKNG